MNDERRTAPRPAPAPSVHVDRRHAVKVVNVTGPRAIKVKPESARNKVTPPRLNDFADDQDNSLRLAELLDDVETSD